MIKIICLADLEKVSDSAARYIAEKELNQLFSLYQVDNISCCGSIFVIESSAEFENFAAMGLTEPINRNFEFTEKYIFKKRNREETYLFGCIIICADFAVDIIINKDKLTCEQLQIFSSTISDKEYTISVNVQGNI